MTTPTPPGAAGAGRARARASSTTQAEPGPGRTLPGSWEGVLNQAREHAQNGNPEAIPLFEKVINGLARLPLSRRKANNERLQNYYLGAVIGLQSFYARRDQFDKSMAVIRDAIPNAEDDDRAYLEQHIVGLQFMAGENDAALDALRRDAEDVAEDVADWAGLVWGYIRCDRAHEALTLLDELATRYGLSEAATAPNAEHELEHDAQADAGDDADEDADHKEDDEHKDRSNAIESDEERATNAASLDALRGIVLLEMGRIDDGIEWFERSLENPHSLYRKSPNHLYSRLANVGRYEDALRFIQRDAGNPARAGFWRGLVYHRQGKLEDARKCWRALTNIDQETANRAPTEVTLSQLYLGDPQGEILSGLLAAIRESEHMHWTLFMLAAVGFAARGDRETAVNDFRLAVGLMKSMSEGRKLPTSLWFMVKDLFKPEDMDLYAQFFEMPLPKVKQEQSADA